MITVCIPVYKRASIFEVVARNLVSLDPKPRVVCGGDWDDPCREICERYGFEYIEVDNGNLATKWNDIFEHAYLSELDCEWFVMSGSDDIITQEQWANLNRMTDGEDLEGRPLQYFGYMGLHLYDTGTKRIQYWPGFSQDHPRHGEPVGPFRAIRRDVMTKLEGRPCVDGSMSVDRDMHNNLLAVGVCCATFYHDEPCQIIDIKSPESKNRFRQLTGGTIVPYSPDLFTPEIHELLTSIK